MVYDTPVVIFSYLVHTPSPVIRKLTTIKSHQLIPDGPDA
ncbi:hypothetical protein EC30301_5424 [Escherichia coli 3030-1]|nr:hypothetical protein EC30301_5424 [Escherichia coli 3030-1]